MDKSKAQKLAEAFKDDWEIDPKAQHGLHKKSGFEIDLGSTWYQNDELHYTSVFWYNPGYGRDGEPVDAHEVTELQREFGILYEAGYMPGRTEQEQAQENLRIEKEAEQTRKEFAAKAQAQSRYWQEHPEEYQEYIKSNREKYEAKKKETEQKWYQERGIIPPKNSNER